MIKWASQHPDWPPSKTLVHSENVRDGLLFAFPGVSGHLPVNHIAVTMIRNESNALWRCSNSPSRSALQTQTPKGQFPLWSTRPVHVRHVAPISFATTPRRPPRTLSWRPRPPPTHQPGTMPHGCCGLDRGRHSHPRHDAQRPEVLERPAGETKRALERHSKSRALWLGIRSVGSVQTSWDARTGAVAATAAHHQRHWEKRWWRGTARGTGAAARWPGGHAADFIAAPGWHSWKRAEEISRPWRRQESERNQPPHKVGPVCTVVEPWYPGFHRNGQSCTCALYAPAHHKQAHVRRLSKTSPERCQGFLNHAMPPSLIWRRAHVSVTQRTCT